MWGIQLCCTFEKTCLKRGKKKKVNKLLRSDSGPKNNMKGGGVLNTRKRKNGSLLGEKKVLERGGKFCGIVGGKGRKGRGAGGNGNLNSGLDKQKPNG